MGFFFLMSPALIPDACAVTSSGNTSVGTGEVALNTHALASHHVTTGAGAPPDNGPRVETAQDADEGRILKKRDGVVNLTGRRSLLDAERQVHTQKNQDDKTKIKTGMEERERERETQRQKEINTARDSG